MKRRKILALNVAAAVVILFTMSLPAASAAYPVPTDQPMPYTGDPTRKVRVACDLDSMKGPEGLALGQIVYNYRQCFQKAGYDFDKSILHFVADYWNNPQSFNDPRRMVSGMTIGLPVHTIAAKALQKQDDLRRDFPADEVAAIAQVSKAASTLKKRWYEDTAAICDEWAMIDLKNAYISTIATSLDDPDVMVTAALLTQNGYKPTDGVRLKTINGALTSLKMTTSHEQGRATFEIDALGNISQR
ncbi:MAG: hypothetical protein ACOYOS_14760 [Syntrophales bacterium]